MRAAAALLAAAACSGGGEGSPVRDAFVPDAVVPDAAVCSMAAPASPAVAPEVVAPVFDIGLPGDGWGEDAALGLIVLSDAVVVPQLKALDRVSLVDQSVTRLPLPADMMLHDIVGNAVVASRGSVLQLCVLDASGAVDEARCGTLDSNQARPFIFDGTAYHLYRARDGEIERVTFDATATPTGTVRITPPDGRVLDVIAATIVDGVEYVVTTDDVDALCHRSRRAHVVTATEHRVHDLLPGDLEPAPWTHRILVARGAAAIVVTGGCTTASCDGASEVVDVLTTFTADGVTPPAALASQRPGSVGFVLGEGDDVVLVESGPQFGEGGSCCTYQPVLTRFAADGTIVHGPVAVAEASGTAWTLAGAALAPGDYVFTYTNDVGLRLRRVQLP
jgi:hypothetical protein